MMIKTTAVSPGKEKLVHDFFKEWGYLEKGPPGRGGAPGRKHKSGAAVRTQGKELS